MTGRGRGKAGLLAGLAGRGWGLLVCGMALGLAIPSAATARLCVAGRESGPNRFECALASGGAPAVASPSCPLPS